MSLLFPSPFRVSKENGEKREPKEKRYLHWPQPITAAFRGEEEEEGTGTALCSPGVPEGARGYPRRLQPVCS